MVDRGDRGIYAGGKESSHLPYERPTVEVIGHLSDVTLGIGALFQDADGLTVTGTDI